MKLIGLHGLPRAGKDSVASTLMRMRFERLAFADPLKQAASILLNRPISQCMGIDYDREQIMPEWGFSMRWFLQKLGTEGVRDVIRQDFWLLRMASEITGYLRFNGDCRLVITDVRFQNEADFIRGLGGQIVQVCRPGIAGSSHASDQPLECDWTLHNSGTLEDLENKVINERRFYNI